MTPGLGDTDSTIAGTQVSRFEHPHAATPPPTSILRRLPEQRRVSPPPRSPGWFLRVVRSWSLICPAEFRSHEDLIFAPAMTRPGSDDHRSTVTRPRPLPAFAIPPVDVSRPGKPARSHPGLLPAFATRHRIHIPRWFLRSCHKSDEPGEMGG